MAQDRRSHPSEGTGAEIGRQLEEPLRDDPLVPDRKTTRSMFRGNGGTVCTGGSSGRLWLDHGEPLTVDSSGGEPGDASSSGTGHAFPNNSHRKPEEVGFCGACILSTWADLTQ